MFIAIILKGYNSVNNVGGFAVLALYIWSNAALFFTTFHENAFNGLTVIEQTRFP